MSRTTACVRAGRAAASALGVVLLMVAGAAPASAANAGAGDLVDVLVAGLDGSGRLVWHGTVSCDDEAETWHLAVHASQGLTVGDDSVDVSCPATGATVNGAIPPILGSWTSSDPVVWQAILQDGLLNSVASQDGDDQITGQDDAVAVDNGSLNADGTVTLTGQDECNGATSDTITATATQTNPDVTGTGSTTVNCPTTGPTDYTITIVATTTAARPTREQAVAPAATSFHHGDSDVATTGVSTERRTHPFHLHGHSFW